MTSDEKKVLNHLALLRDTTVSRKELEIHWHFDNLDEALKSLGKKHYISRPTNSLSRITNKGLKALKKGK